METIIIDDSTDSEDDVELIKAIKLSKQEQSNHSYKNHSGSTSKLQSTLTTISTTRSSNINSKRNLSDLGGFKIDVIDKKPKKFDNNSDSNPPSSTISRVQLEKERLSRLNQNQSNNAGSSKLDPIFKKQELGSALHIPSLKSTSSKNSSSQIPSKNYWNPEIHRVSNRMSLDDGGFSLSEVIGLKTGPEEWIPHTAVVSSYALQADWLSSHFDEATSLLIVCPKPEESTRLTGKAFKIDSELKHQNLYMLYPEATTKPRGAMHVKCCLLFYGNFMRVIISSANFVDYDWHSIDNASLFQDFPLLSSNIPTPKHPTNNPTHTKLFSLPLFKFFQELNVPPSFLKGFMNYDFSLSEEIRLIFSKQGYWRSKNDSMELGGGMIGLAKAVKSLNFQKGGKWSIEATGSSIGALTNIWLLQFLGAASGINPVNYFDKNHLTPKSLPSPPSSSKKSLKNFKLPIKILFPTLEEIDNSYSGRAGGGTIFLKSTLWKGKKFPKHLFYKGESKRNGVMAHTKIILAIKKRTKDDDKDGFRNEGWVYVGSHNFTQAAWGQLENSDMHSTTQITIKNYELGVLLPVRSSTEKGLEKWMDCLVSYKRPCSKYTEEDTPWMQSDFE